MTLIPEVATWPMRTYFTRLVFEIESDQNVNSNVVITILI